MSAANPCTGGIMLLSWLSDAMKYDGFPAAEIDGAKRIADMEQGLSEAVMARSGMPSSRLAGVEAP